MTMQPITDKQTVHAVSKLMLQHASIKSFEYTTPFFKFCTFKQWDNVGVTIEHTNINNALNWLWSNTNNRILLSLSGSYYLCFDFTLNEQYKFIGVKLVKRDNRKNDCTCNEVKNIIGGYWYTAEHEVPKTALDKLDSKQVKLLIQSIRDFNNSRCMYRKFK